ncbi:uncharacterized protein Eint_110370 [Encephalitozoon intestinalis ATCC 50506]|uniref:Uncharacterized protein n=1 Tax=Encephalitozoon intestinalis (strain ATCC 50506) TaxID=876142 RepID=E0SAB2_ENCIT|nr:uncharacterized protein Eint_110370 [Encephalitozoon intestinalis ATCC 50506]ADM12537.1 hypothetical protein Eint_110370 [Encephalitozoon intestinalis ATCC 50506]UTX46391.1 hypothetical protein GPK93_11g19980 [Encephalitozoon intestinalis]
MEVSGRKEGIKSSLNDVELDISNDPTRLKKSSLEKMKIQQLFKNGTSVENCEEESLNLGYSDSKVGPFITSKDLHEENKEDLSSNDGSSSSDCKDSDECEGLLSIYSLKEAENLYKNIKTPSISDMAIEKNRRNHPNPKFLCNAEGRNNYTVVLEDLYFKQKTKSLKKEIKLKHLLEEFFSELDKFVLIANYCLKSTEISDGDEDFNFALEWIRDAFHWLGIEGAKYYARKSPGPYSGWVSDVEFLMNRYFFSPDFNHVNGFDIKQSVHEGYGFVENRYGKFHLSYQPYPGYYDVSKDTIRFCSECNLLLPPSLCLLDSRCQETSDEKEEEIS